MGDYYATSDMWGASGTGMRQHTVFCKPENAGGVGSWFADAMIPADSGGSVKSYPNEHADYMWLGGRNNVEPPVSDYPTLTATWHHNSPDTCAGCSYDWSHEMWLNHYAVEVMIWTDYKVQTPAFADATLQDTVTIDGRSWEVWRAVWGGTGTSRDGYIVFLPADHQPVTGGTMDLRAFLGYMQPRGWLGAAPTISAITYGVELCNTGGVSKRFDVLDYKITPLS